jgi:hypothetical protein
MARESIITDRVTVDIDDEFVVLLIGMRINKWWKIHKWLPVAVVMWRMISELSKDRDSGLLSGEYHLIGNPIVYLQYWRSYDALEAYAHDASRKHHGAWSNFYRRVGTNGDVGIWHEAYRIAPGHYECVYINLPPFGLGRLGKLISARGGRKTSRGRMERLRSRRSEAAAVAETASESQD